MCDEWKNDYKAFHDWCFANGYEEKAGENGVNILTIDRIDVNGDYEPNNCRFITNEEQAKNKRDTLTNEERYAVCPICGKEYIKTQRNGSKTCSYKCGAIRREMNRIKKDYTKICIVCGKKFVAGSDHFNQRKCCSRECSNLIKSPIWEFNGESNRVIEWAEITGINAHCLLHRKNDLGWSIERTLTTPIKRSANAE